MPKLHINTQMNNKKLDTVPLIKWYYKNNTDFKTLIFVITYLPANLIEI